MNKHAEQEFINGALARRLERAELVAERDRLMLERDNAPASLRRLRENQIRDINLKIAAL